MKNWCRKVEVSVGEELVDVLVYIDVAEGGKEHVKIKSMVGGLYIEETIQVSWEGLESLTMLVQTLSRDFLGEFVAEVAENNGAFT